MQIGTLALFQRHSYDASVTDSQVYREELKLASQLEAQGYDSHWCVEHHFEDYSFCPDNVVYLAHLAAITKTLKLATGAVIVPWNTPLRVAERIALLDELSDGRVIFGMGRGLSRREYDQFGIDMDTSRDRFDEAAPMILKALETGVIEGNGKYYKQPLAKIRPAPTRSFKDRVTQVAMSPESALECATNRAQMMVFTQKSMAEHNADFEPYRALYQKLHNAPPPPPLMAGITVCHQDAGRAEELARKHVAGYLLTVMHHYELMGDHFKKAKGYESYGEAVDMLRDIGLEGMANAYVDAQIWGTPDQMLEKLTEMRRVIGDCDVLFGFRAAGMPYADAENSQRLIAEKVIPEIRSWDKAAAA
ncbi:MAG: LLM class flavin-dependent oxidoreductase [Proteobacteria bacterium]|nr:LLM class flavin-dependent oxidoreductase [Pseudomonadota bacterium]